MKKAERPIYQLMTTMDLLPLGLALFMFASNLVNGDQCTFHGPCSCNTENYKIDLSPIMKHSKKALYTSYLGFKYYIDPCGTGLTIPECKSLGPEAAGCQQQRNDAYGIASTSGYSATGDPEAGTVTFTYSYEVRKTKLVVKCSSHERKLTCTGEHPQLTYNFLLETKYACKHIPSSGDSGGLSIGSVLCIMFFVLVIVYIIGGILFLKYYRKEEGKDIIPNRVFWMEVPLLAKDGVVFIIAKAKGSSTYEKI